MIVVLTSREDAITHLIPDLTRGGRARGHLATPEAQPPQAFSHVETRPRIGRGTVTSCPASVSHRDIISPEMLAKFPFFFFVMSLGLLRVKVNSLIFPFLPFGHPYLPERYPNR